MTILIVEVGTMKVELKAVSNSLAPAEVVDLANTEKTVQDGSMSKAKIKAEAISSIMAARKAASADSTRKAVDLMAAIDIAKTSSRMRKSQSSTFNSSSKHPPHPLSCREKGQSLVTQER